MVAADLASERLGGAQQGASFGYGGNHSFSLLPVAEVVTGGLGYKILHRQAATLGVDAGTPPVVWSKASKHPQIGELCIRRRTIRFLPSYRIHPRGVASSCRA
jgi:hypothetical protein